MTTKYHATPAVVDGLRFDSQAEGRRYTALKILAASGEISDLEIHPKYELQPGFTDNTGKRQRAIVYEADFAYTENGVQIVEDVKGFQTPVWKLKQKLFLYRYAGRALRVTK